MEIRQATTADTEGIRRVAGRSLEANYGFVDDEELATAVENWYGDDALEATLTDTGDVVLVAVDDGEIVGLSQSAVLGEGESVGEIRWLHVDPAHRDRGIGSELLERTEEVLQGQGVDRIRGVVLEGNEDGVAFYDEQGFRLTDKRPVSVGEEAHTELVYESGPGAGEDPEDFERYTLDGDTVYAYLGEADRGSGGDFHPVYRSRDRDTLAAWLCSACGAIDNAMDPMGRLECNECGNTRKPTRWDAAYL